MFELEADHHLEVHRYVLRPPEGQHRKRAVLDFMWEWGAVLWAVKCRQYEAYRKHRRLPMLPAAWGDVSEPRMMPCVVWIKLEKRQQRMTRADRRIFRG